MALIIHSFETSGNVSYNKHNSFELDIFKPWNYSCLLNYYHDFNSMERCWELCINWKIVIECRKKNYPFNSVPESFFGNKQNMWSGSFDSSTAGKVLISIWSIKMKLWSVKYEVKMEKWGTMK